jgi:hypothetical protein
MASTLSPPSQVEEGDDEREKQLHTIAGFVLPHLPLSVQAITLPALSKAWKQWAEEQRAKERALVEAKSGQDSLRVSVMFQLTGMYPFSINPYAPLWAAQQQGKLSDEQRRRFQLRAAAHGDVGAVDWFGVSDNPGHHRELCASAACGGQLQALKWLRDCGCDWDAKTCAEAARGGHLAVLQWARANGCDWDVDTCSEAAGNGHLAVLQWARANGCNWDAGTCAAAAEGGHLGVLQWARANGCAFDDVWTYGAAALGGHPAMMQWARANCSPAPRSTP